MNHLTNNKSNEKAEMVAHLIDMNETDNPEFGNSIVYNQKFFNTNSV